MIKYKKKKQLNLLIISYLYLNNYVVYYVECTHTHTHTAFKHNFGVVKFKSTKSLDKSIEFRVIKFVITTYREMSELNMKTVCARN